MSSELFVYVAKVIVDDLNEDARGQIVYNIWLFVV